jgi:hypothetical protein
VALDSNIELLLAVMDLKLVQMLRAAMQPMNAGCCGKPATELGPRPDCIERRFRYTPEPVIEPRDHFHPTPKIEPRQVIRPRPRVELAPAPILIPPCPEAPHKPKCGMVPPWKVLPWENPPQPALKIKVIKTRPDIVRKGSLIDCFM